MKDDYISKFSALGYNRSEIQDLLGKIADGNLLTKNEYIELMVAIDEVRKSTTFNRDYIIESVVDSLTKEANIFNALVDTDDFANKAYVDLAIGNLLTGLQSTVDKMLDEFKVEMDEAKADKDHTHDDRYSFNSHKHEGVYVTTTDIGDYVTKEYLDEVLSNYSGGGGNVNPIYVKPTLSVKSNVSSVQHKKETRVTLTPNFSQNDAGKLVKFSVIKDSQVLFEDTKVDSIEVTLNLKHGEAATYVFKVEYEAGPIKNTAAGVPYPDTAIKAGSLTTSYSVKCTANSYVGAIPDRAFKQTDIQNFTSVRNQSKSYTHIYSLDEQKSVYMYPRSFGELTSIKDTNNFDYINSYTRSILVYDDIEYFVYVLTDAVVMTGGFKQTFN